MKYIVIDSHFLCHRAKYSYVDFEDIGDNSGVIFGFLKQIMDLSDKFESNKFIFCWDSVTSKRKEIFPEYKVKPNKKELLQEEIDFNNRCFLQFDEIKNKVLPSIGFSNVFSQKGYEADDIIASIVMGYEEDFVVVTRDNDFMQLLSWCSIWDPISKTLSTPESFFEKMGIDCQRWAEVKAIAGCKSDSVPGILGVGETTAIKYLQNKLKPSSVKYQSIVLGKEIIKRNRNLIDLPFPGTIIPNIEPDFFNFNNFYMLVNQYSIDTLLDRRSLNWWTNFMERKDNDNEFNCSRHQSYL